MLFFKPKPKFDEILPPPPPFPSLELEKAKAGTLEKKEFSDLIRKLGEGSKQKKVMGKKGKGIKKTPIAKKGKIPKKVQKKLKKVSLNKLTKLLTKKLTKEKKPTLKKIKTIKKKIKKPKIEFPELEESLELEGLDFKFPKELKPSKKEIELPETLEEFDTGDIEKDLEETKKPKEILEAEEEIKGAIEKIKEQEKPSFLKKLFVKNGGIEEKSEEYLIPESGEVDEVSVIQSNIKNAREALMKFDLETAKKNYIEIMKLYNRIKPEDQAKIYQDIRDLYFERKSAEELKV